MGPTPARVIITCTCLQIRVCIGTYFLYFSSKENVVVTQKNRLNETVLLSTQNTCLNERIENTTQGSKILLVRSYLRVSQAAGQVNVLKFLVKIKFSPCMPINFVMQGKCLFSDISRPATKSGPSSVIAQHRMVAW